MSSSLCADTCGCAGVRECGHGWQDAIGRGDGVSVSVCVCVCGWVWVGVGVGGGEGGEGISSLTN